MFFRIICFSTACILGLISSGCSTPKGDFVVKSEQELIQMELMNDKAHSEFTAGNYSSAMNILDSIGTERTVSRPLYQLEKLSVLLMDGKFDEAHEQMMALHVDFETLFDKKSEEKAQSVWHGEVNKVYKGDSYERSTFYALMALSFICKGEYEDAIRCVKNGLLADADSNSESALDDYALLHYLGYFASLKLDDKDEADEYLRAMYNALAGRGLKQDEDGKPLAETCIDYLKTSEPNVFLVVWAGQPPTVVRTGEYEEVRSIISGKNYFDAMSISVGNDFTVMMPNNLADVNYQATTRGGRLMDNVLADKAMAKKGMEVTRNIFLLAGSGLLIAGSRCMGAPALGLSLIGAGVGCYVIGGTAWIVGYYMNPAADARYWRNLPGQFYLIPLKLPAGRHKVAFTGFLKSDRVSMAMYDINVEADKALNIFHLPMMNFGSTAANVVAKRLQVDYNAAVSRAENNRTAKELK